MPKGPDRMPGIGEPQVENEDALIIEKIKRVAELEEELRKTKGEIKDWLHKQIPESLYGTHIGDDLRRLEGSPGSGTIITVMDENLKWYGGKKKFNEDLEQLRKNLEPVATVTTEKWGGIGEGTEIRIHFKEKF